MHPIKRKFTSEDNRSIRYVFGLSDNREVEASYFKLDDYDSMCVSSQVGCFTNCKFCATGQLPYSRNLKFQEIIDQIEAILYDVHEWRDDIKISFMGQGEPLVNVRNVLRAREHYRTNKSIRFSLSTVGYIPGINALIEARTDIRLQISLHSPDDLKREILIPLNKKYALRDLIEAGKKYYQSTNHPVCYNYSLIEGCNDSDFDLQRLVKLFKDVDRSSFFIKMSPFHALNGYARSNVRQEKFTEHLTKVGIRVVQFESYGETINSGCGQLKNA